MDPRKAGSAFAVGTQTLLPGAEVPSHRHLYQDEVLFIHKGQGRATVEGRGLTVVPGVMVYVPRQVWHSLRNNGTGVLHFTWTVAPPGIEEFFRELSKLGASPGADALQALGQRYGVEFGKGEASAVAPAAAGIAASSPKTGHGRRRRHRRGRGVRAGQPAPAPAAPPPASSSAPSVRPAPSAQAAKPQRSRDQGQPRRGRGRRVKEVYMGGRWVPVSGEGPVIAPGRERPKRGRGDEGTPSGPLSVPL